MISKDMKIGDILKISQKTEDILMSFGMGCVGCPSAQSESLEDAAEIHGIELDELIEELNKAV